MTHDIYTYLMFSYRYTHTPLLKENEIFVVIAVFLSKLDHRTLFNDIYYKTILVWGLVSTGYIMLVKIC